MYIGYRLSRTFIFKKGEAIHNIGSVDLGGFDVITKARELFMRRAKT